MKIEVTLKITYETERSYYPKKIRDDVNAIAKFDEKNGSFVEHLQEAGCEIIKAKEVKE